MKATKAPSLLWIVARLAIVGAVIWYFLPGWSPPAPVLPATRGAADFIRWTYQDTTTNGVVQALTIRADGSSELLVTRSIGDPDLPEAGPNLKLRRNKETGLIEFRRANTVPATAAKELYAATVAAGLVGVQDVPTPPDRRLTIAFVLGGGPERSVTGPQSLGAAFDWNRARWINQLHWSKIVDAMNRRVELRQQLEKKEIVLVDDAGNPVPAN